MKKVGRPLRDLTGQTFGRLFVLQRAANLGSTTRWLCLCLCGSRHIVRYDALAYGRSRSCGCYRSDFMKEKHARAKDKE